MPDEDGESLSHYEQILKLSYTNLIACRALYTAVELGIPDLVRGSSLTTEEISSRRIPVLTHSDACFECWPELVSLQLLMVIAFRSHPWECA